MDLAELKKQFFHFQKGEVMAFERKLNMGMVGGGKDAFIGAVHRSAALLDGKVNLVAFMHIRDHRHPHFLADTIELPQPVS